MHLACERFPAVCPAAVLTAACILAAYGYLRSSNAVRCLRNVF
jgi:hypothetical protein